MSLARHAKKRDANEAEIVEALRKAGAQVWLLDSPVDLLVRWRGRWELIEVKVPDARPRKDQAHQADFCARYGVPVVRTAEEALYGIGILET